jgi:hypothetical protein
MTEAEALHAVLRRARAIIAGERLVGGPRAAAFDLGSIAAKALGEELRAADVVQGTWEPPETRGRGK